jgi:hypothetical protein
MEASKRVAVVGSPEDLAAFRGLQEQSPFSWAFGLRKNQLSFQQRV